jgi:hypothetical protein
VKLDPAPLEQDELGVGRRQEHLASRLAQNLEKTAVSATIQLARHVVQEQNRHSARALGKQIELCGFQSQHDRPVLPL